MTAKTNWGLWREGIEWVEGVPVIDPSQMDCHPPHIGSILMQHLEFKSGER